MGKTPVQKLMDRLLPRFARHRMAYDVTWKLADQPGRVAEARDRMSQEERAVEYLVRTWAYEELIEKLQTLTAYNDPGHFDHCGIKAVVEYLQNELQRMGVKDGKGESQLY